MAFPNKYKYYIYELIGGVPYYFILTSGGAVTTTTTKYNGELEYAPDEWDDTDLTWNRSESLHGIFSKTSNQYTFHGDGGKILNYIILTRGYDVKVKLLVEVRRDSDMLHELFSDDDINLSDPQINYDEQSVTVSLFESGMGSDFKANLDTPYEIPLTGSDVITVEHEGTTVLGRYNYRYGESSLIGKYFGEVTPGGAANGEYLSHLLVPITSEGLRPIAAERTNTSLNMGEHFQNEFYIGGSGLESQQYDNFSLAAYQTIEDVTINYKASFDWRINAPAFLPATCYFIVDVIVAYPLLSFSTRQRIYTGTTNVISSVLTTITENINVSGVSIPDLQDGQQLYFCVAIMSNDVVSVPSLGTEIFTKDPSDSRVSIEFKFQSTKSDIQGFRLHTLAQKTVEAFADGKYGSTPFNSPLLSSPSTWIKGTYPYRTIITNGNAIKGITDSVFKLSMKDIIDDVQANYGCGVGVTNDQLTIGAIADFYDDDTLIADLGELTDVIITPINDMATNIVFGNKFDNDNDTLNGSFDYNTQSTFKTPNISEKESKKEYVSPIVASIFNIERLRVSEAGKDTTANKVNDDLYKMEVVETASGGKYKLSYASFAGSTNYRINGVLSFDTSYNIAFSPKNMYLRLKPIINSNAYPSTTEVTFQKSERSKTLDSQYYDTTTMGYTDQVYENQGFSPDGTELLWLPFDIKCKSLIPINLDALLATNKYGKFKGTWKGKDIHFYLKQAKMKPSNRNTFEWEGLIAPSTNILDLIF